MPTFDPTKTAFWLIPADIKEIEKPARKPKSSTVSISKLKDDIKMLESGLFADCTVISRDQTWATHKVILSRSPYFAGAFSSSNGFKEAVESKITIENFEPFEVSWLLQYIYGLRINVENSKETTASKSFLETCALLWTIGDFFCLEDLCQSVLTQLQRRCRTLLLQSRCASTMVEKIDFLPDLEAGIRAAWRHDRVASPVRQDIISLCVAIHPFVKNHASFISLLDEMSEFTAQYVKALLGCAGMQSVKYYERRAIYCDHCGDEVFDFDEVPLSDEAFVWTPTSLNLWDNCPYWFCSRDCYNERISQQEEHRILPD